MGMELPPDAEDGPPDYLAGMCHVFALALHREYGFKMLALFDKAERYGQRSGSTVAAVHHIYAVDPDGIAYDRAGIRPAADVVTQWMHVERDTQALVRHRPAKVTLTSEDGLQRYVSDGWGRPLRAYTDEQVVAALACAQDILAEHLPPKPGTGSAPAFR